MDDLNELNFDDVWKIVTLFYEDQLYTNDSVHSFDKFILNINNIPIPNIEIESEKDNNGISKIHKIQFVNYYIGKAMLNEDDPNKKSIFLSHPKNKNKAENISIVLPHENRERCLTYSIPIYYDIIHDIYKKNSEGEIELFNHKMNNKVCIGNIPLPTGSEWCNLQLIPDLKHECPYSKSGTFIINGNDKNVIPQGRMEYNSIFISKKIITKPMLVAQVRCLAENDFSDPSVIYINFKTYKGKDDMFKLKFPYINYDINVVVIFRALGIESDKEICDMIIQNTNYDMIKYLRPTLEEKEGLSIYNQNDALIYIGKKSQTFENKDDDQYIKYAINLINRDLFPHMGKTIESFKLKGYFLGYCIHKILRVHLGIDNEDNRDHCSRKRFELVGPLLEDIYRELIESLCRDMKSILSKWIKEEKPIGDISSFFKKKTITNKLKYVLATGNWTSKVHKTTNKTGVSTITQTLSYASYLSHLRRINTPIGRQGNLHKPRELNWDQWRMIDPSETPDSGNIGLVNNFALLSHITMGDSSFHLMDIIYKLNFKPLEKCKIENLNECRVFINGKWIGMTNNPNYMIKILREMKRSCDINSETGISYKSIENSIFISTDSGRIRSPLFVVKDNKILLTKKRIEELKLNDKNSISCLIAEGIIELLDVSEEENSMIAMFLSDLKNTDIKYTHCEIHPSIIYGEVNGSISYLNHNPSPRITFQGAMGKHAIGIPKLNFYEKMDTMQHVLYYPQKPITYTKTAELVKINDLPTGMECIVMIGLYDGFNMEDAIVFNRRSIENGMFRSIFYRTYKDIEQKFGNHHSEEFSKLNRETCSGMRPGNCDKLGEDGIVDINTFISSDDYIIGKISKYTGTESKYTHKDYSTINRNSENGIVDRVLITQNEDGFRTTKVRIRSIRKPTIGDKFSSRHGQKGVIGLLVDPEDLPFSVKDGIVPDIIINPHAIPSRMTIGMILEMLSGKIGCLTGKRIDSTCFEDCNNSESIKKTLENSLNKLGYKKDGNEIFIDGRTGMLFHTPLFIGTCYYQRLKHMVDDKIHARNKGPVNILTRQPTEGRSRDGGLRFGEMERDCTIAYGASSILHSRTMTLSDECEVYYCKCGNFAYKNFKTNIYYCSKCIHITEIRKMKIPYAFKLMIQELMSMGIMCKMVLGDDKESKLK